MEKKDTGLFRKGFLSEIDQFLQAYDKANPDFCASRRREIAKFEKIAALRDAPIDKEKE